MTDSVSVSVSVYQRLGIAAVRDRACLFVCSVPLAHSGQEASWTLFQRLRFAAVGSIWMRALRAKLIKCIGRLSIVDAHISIFLLDTDSVTHFTEAPICGWHRIYTDLILTTWTRQLQSLVIQSASVATCRLNEFFHSSLTSALALGRREFRLVRHIFCASCLNVGKPRPAIFLGKDVISLTHALIGISSQSLMWRTQSASNVGSIQVSGRSYSFISCNIWAWM